MMRNRRTAERTGRWFGGPAGQDLSGVPRLELFIISAVTAILLTRAYLRLSDYPQLGGGGLHIAHTLWGSLLMLCGQLLLLGFLRPAPRNAGAVLGGVGFGLTLDEVGKFVTSDNDYFFQPTFAIIYAVFVAIVLATQWLFDHGRNDPTTLLANAVNLAEAGLFGRMTEQRRAEALRLVERAAALGANADHVRATRQLVQSCEPAHPRVGGYARFRRMVRRTTRTAVRSRAARVLAILLLALIVVDTAATAIPEIFFESAGELTDARTVQLGTKVLMAALIIAGFLWWLRDRRGAIRIARYAVLLNLLVGQVFNFAHRQLDGLAGVVVSLGLLAVLNQALRTEPDRDPRSR